MKTKVFKRLSFINQLKEMIGFHLYFDGKNYFYAWDAKHAIKKMKTNTLWIIDDYGVEHKINIMLNGS